MEHNDLLDVMLYSYLNLHQWKLKKDSRYTRATFNSLIKAQHPDIEDWNIEFVKNRLIEDGFIEPYKFGEGEPYNITPEGIKAAQNGHYSSVRKDKEQRELITKLTIKSLQDSRRALIVAILAFIIPVGISIYTLYKNYELATKEEVQVLKDEIKILQSNIQLLNKTSNK